MLFGVTFSFKPENVLVNGITVVRKTASLIVFKVSPIVCKLTAFGKADLYLFKRRWQYILAQATLRRVPSPSRHLPGANSRIYGT